MRAFLSLAKRTSSILTSTISVEWTPCTHNLRTSQAMMLSTDASTDTSVTPPLGANAKELIHDLVKAPLTRHNETKARLLCDQYRGSNAQTRRGFIDHLIKNYCLNPDSAEDVIENFLSKKNRGEAYALVNMEKLRESLEPPYMNLFNKIARLEDGVKFLVDLRADILNVINELNSSEEIVPKLRLLSEHLKKLLALWFSVGFLNLERITWDSSCDIMQKISEYEAVHPVRSWTDVKQRVGPYRRCFIFHHNCLPREPLVILHVALTREISSSIADIVRSPPFFGHDHSSSSSATNGAVRTAQLEDVNNINAAIFYSISSPQKGLNGIDLGNQMIRRVGHQIKGELPHVSQYSSLSPIPGFREYFLTELQKTIKAKDSRQASFLTVEEIERLRKHLMIPVGLDHRGVWSTLFGLLKTPSWIHDHQLVQLLRLPLMRKCARYLCSEKRRGFALNRVAHFHLRNGAVIWRLNWAADLSPRGLSNSFGIMVNYRYYTERLDQNSQNYTEKQIVRVDQNLDHLLLSSAT